MHQDACRAGDAPLATVVLRGCMDLGTECKRRLAERYGLAVDDVETVAPSSPYAIDGCVVGCGMCDCVERSGKVCLGIDISWNGLTVWPTASASCMGHRHRRS